MGLSFRTTNNSYFKLKLGYNIAPKVKLKDYEYEYSDPNIDKWGVSSLFLNIGFTHTFSWGENWFK